MSPEKLLACDNTRFNNYHSSLYYNYRLTVLKSINETFHWAINYLTHCVSCSTFTISLKKILNFCYAIAIKDISLQQWFMRYVKGFSQKFSQLNIFREDMKRKKTNCHFRGSVRPNINVLQTFCKFAMMFRRTFPLFGSTFYNHHLCTYTFFKMICIPFLAM